VFHFLRFYWFRHSFGLDSGKADPEHVGDDFSVIGGHVNLASDGGAFPDVLDDSFDRLVLELLVELLNRGLPVEIPRVLSNIGRAKNGVLSKMALPGCVFSGFALMPCWVTLIFFHDSFGSGPTVGAHQRRDVNPVLRILVDSFRVPLLWIIPKALQLTEHSSQAEVTIWSRRGMQFFQRCVQVCTFAALLNSALVWVPNATNDCSVKEFP